MGSYSKVAMHHHTIFRTNKDGCDVVTTCPISHSLHFRCHERCGARGSCGHWWLVGELLPRVHAYDNCLDVHKYLLSFNRYEEQRGHSWKTLWMKTGGLDEVWASETAQVFTLKRFSGISMDVHTLLQHSPHGSAPTTHQSPPSGITKRLLLCPWQEALRALVSFGEETLATKDWIVAEGRSLWNSHGWK